MSTPKTHFNSFMGIYPPPEFWKPIQDIRLKNIPPPIKAGPHFTVVRPFFSEESLPSCKKVLQKRLLKVKPFKVNLKKFNYFSLKTKNYIYLEPEDTSEFKRVFDIVMETFPELEEKLNKNKFTPHLSVAELPKSVNVIKLMEEFQSNWKELTFEVKEIYFLTCIENKYEIREIVQLGDEGSIPFFETITEEESKKKLKK
jgi:2'-5' RNA ligase